MSEGTIRVFISFDVTEVDCTFPTDNQLNSGPTDLPGVAKHFITGPEYIVCIH